MNPDRNRTLVNETWTSSIVPTLEQYIRIPNQSPLFDPDWKSNGHMHQAVALAKKWVESQGIKGLTIDVHEIDDRTPVIFMEIEGDASSTVLMYGHLDKQPAMVGWEEGLGPWTPVLRDGKLFGRGGADEDRKSTRLNSSHGYISYAVFCLKKKMRFVNRSFLLLTG